MDEEQELDEMLERLQEVGKSLSAANKKILEEIKASASKLEYHPTAQKIISMCEEMLKTGEVVEASQEIEEAEELEEKDFSQDRRAELAKKGWALPDGSFPIENLRDLANAIKASGRAANPAAAKEHIIKRARELKATDKLPSDWNVKESVSEDLEEANFLGKIMQMMTSGASDEDMIKMAAENGMDEAKAKAMIKKMKANRVKMKEAHADSSMEDTKDMLQRALEDKFGSKVNSGMPMGMCWIQATYDDYVIAAIKEKSMKIPYSIMEGKVTFGEPVEVEKKTEYVPTKESIQIIEAVKDSGGREWDVILIAEGLSKNGNYYPKETLEKAISLFEGSYAFADHATDAERMARPERSVKDKVGRFSGVQYGIWNVISKQVEGLKARFKVIAPWLREVLVEAMKANEPDFLGFSIDAEGKVAKRQVDKRMVNYVESIISVHSVDVVTDPSAGGQIMRLVASNKPNEEGILNMEKEELAALLQEQVSQAVATALAEAKRSDEDEIKQKLAELESRDTIRVRESRIDTALDGVTISEVGRKRLQTTYRELAQRREFTDEEIQASITEAQGYEAAIAAQYQKPESVVRTKMGLTTEDRYYKAMAGIFEREDIDGVPRFRTIKEAYCRWTGADSFNVHPMEIMRAFSCKYDSGVDHGRLQESLTTAGWGEVYADVLYNKLIKDYRASKYNNWRLVCSDIENVPDFRTRHWTRVGGYADLTSVAEQATYPTLTTPTDEEVTYAIGKYGGMDDVTFESIVNDNIGAIRKIPGAMARSASRTLWKFVFNLVTTDNPTMDYDSVVLYIAGHSNTGTTALSLDGLATTLALMRDQTAYNESSEILGARNNPKFLIVPNELQYRAQRIINPTEGYYIAATASSGTDIDSHAFKGLGIEVIVYDVLTDATNWYAVADPNEVPTVVIGFLNGQEEPELFVQDQPNVGSNFTADKVTYKIRHIYGGDVIDHRSFYRQVVAG